MMFNRHRKQSRKSTGLIELLEQRRLLTNSVFVHPGVLNTQADFTRMATKVAANAQPWLADWNALKSQGYAQLGASPLATRMTCHRCFRVFAFALGFFLLAHLAPGATTTGLWTT